MTKERLVVIGNGMVGARFVEELLERDGTQRFDVVMFGEERYGNYNRILLSSVLAGSHEPGQIVMNPLEWYSAKDVTLHSGVRVESIDRTNKIVLGSGGISESYDRLVFATGSSPFVPPMEGLYGPSRQFREGIFVFRTLDDSLNIINYAAGARKAVVVGGGLLGLEAARGLLNRGLEVHVVELMPHPMAVQLDAPAGGVLRATLEGMGIHFHLGQSIASALGNGKIDGVVFKNGAIESCDMLVISAGIRPNVAIAKHAGLTVERGIVVGDDLACLDDPAIYAIGECAQHRGQTYGLVAPGWEQAEILANRLSQTEPNAIYNGSSTSTKLKVMGVDLAVLGKKDPADEQDEVITYGDARRGIYKKLILRDGRVAGAILLGDSSAAARLLRAFQKKEKAPENPGELLFQTGSAQKGGILEEPDSVQVCNCNGVTKGRILEAIRAGCKTVKAISETTRACTGCSTCMPLVKEILDAARDATSVETPKRAASGPPRKSDSQDPLKEVVAVLRPETWIKTRRKLESLGIVAFTQHRVVGRGRQRGLHFLARRGATSGTGFRYLPKRMVSWILPESQVDSLIQAIMETNRTGQIGDGKIFVMPLDGTMQIRTGERDTESVQAEVVCV